MTIPDRSDNESLCRIFGNVLLHHLMGLAVSLRTPSGRRQCVYSGFLLKYRGVPFWVTAGHVLREIYDDILKPGTNPASVNASWLDGLAVGDASSRPVDLPSLLHFEVDRGPLDLGVVVLRDYDLTHLAACGKNFLNDTDLAAKSVPIPSTLYLGGFPHVALQAVESTKFGTTGVSGKTHVFCIPCATVTPSHGEGDEFWNKGNSIYMRASPLRGNSGLPITDYHGMSGGPVFAVRTDEQDKIAFTLFGIQSACSDLDPLSLRATDIEMLKGALDAILNAVEKTHRVEIR